MTVNVGVRVHIRIRIPGRVRGRVGDRVRLRVRGRVGGQCLCPCFWLSQCPSADAADAGHNCKDAIMNLLIKVFWEF